MKWLLLFFLSVPLCAWAGDPTCAKTAITLRKGPGTQFPVSWKVGRFMPFLKIENKKGWTKVTDMDGEAHWAPTRELTNSFRCVAVKAQIANLRQAPLAAAPNAELKTVDRYTPLKRLESESDWLQVEDEIGHRAWISSSQVWTPLKIQAIDF